MPDSRLLKRVRRCLNCDSARIRLVWPLGDPIFCTQHCAACWARDALAGVQWCADHEVWHRAKGTANLPNVLRGCPGCRNRETVEAE